MSREPACEPDDKMHAFFFARAKPRKPDNPAREPAHFPHLCYQQQKKALNSDIY